MMNEESLKILNLTFSVMMKTCMYVNLEENQRVDSIRRTGKIVKPGFHVSRKEGYKVNLSNK